MSKAIFQVLSNLRHDASTYLKGQLFEDDLATFKHLVEDGVLAVVEGAKDLKHAEEIIASRASQLIVEAQKEATQEPANTWGPKPDEVKMPEGAKTDGAVGAQDPAAPSVVAPGQIGVGDLPPNAGDKL